MKKRFSIPIAVLFIFFLSGLAALAQESAPDGAEQAAPSEAAFKEAQTLLTGNTADTLPDSREMFNYISNLVEQTKNLPAESISAGAPLEFGRAYDQIGTFDNWTTWIGWNGSFSDSYAPESESYSWVVYFAPEGVYVALQNAVSVYSGVNVFGSIGQFMGSLASPDGAVVKASYLGDLYGITFSLGNSISKPIGPLSGLGMSYDTGVTVFRPKGTTNIQRGIQYNGGFTVSFDLISFPLPLSVSLDRECTAAEKLPPKKLCAFYGFYPIIDWSNMQTIADTPIDIVAERLQLLASRPGTTFVDVMTRQFAKTLLPFFTQLKTPGPVTMTNTDLPTTAQLFRQFQQNNRITVPATAPKPSIDHFITSVETWLKTGNVNGISTDIRRSSQVLADPPEVFKRLGAGTGLGFEMAYKHAAVYYNYAQTFADCSKEIICEVGKTCSVTVTTGEIAPLVPDSTASDFEGAWVWFNYPSENFLASGDSGTWIQIKSGKATYSFVHNTSSPVLIGPDVEKTALTNYKTIKLCRRIVQIPSKLPTVTIAASDPNATEAGDTGRFIIRRTGDTSQDLLVKFDVGGSAIRAKDYTTFPVYKKIPAGSASVNITVSPIKDTLSEAKETVIIRLSNDAAYTVGLQSKATVFIANTP